MRREIHDSASIEVYRVRNVISHCLATDARFNSDYEGMRRAGRISDACDLEPSPAPIFIDEGDWEKLVEALKAPMPLRGQAPYLISPAHRMMHIVELVLEAKQEK